MQEEFVLFCSGCGNKLKMDDVFCPKCGKKVETQNVQEENILPAEGQEEKMSKPIQTKSTVKRGILKFVLGGIGFCLALIIIMILIGDWFDIIWEVFLTIFYFAFFGYVANQLVDLYEKTNHDVVAITGLIICAVVFGVALLETWDILPIFEFEALSKIFGALTIALIAFCHSAKLLTIKIKNNDAKRALDLTLPILFTTYGLWIIIDLFSLEVDFLTRVSIILLLLTIFGSIAVPILNKIK